MGSGSERVALVQLARAGLQSPDEATLAPRARFLAFVMGLLAFSAAACGLTQNETTS